MAHREINRQLVDRLVNSGYTRQMATDMITDARTGSWRPGDEIPESMRHIISTRDMTTLYNLVNQEEGSLVAASDRQLQNVKDTFQETRFRGPLMMPNAEINRRMVQRLEQLGFPPRIANDVVVLARRELAGQRARDDQIPNLFGRPNYDLLVRTLRDSVADRRTAGSLIGTLMLRPELRVSPTVATETTQDRESRMYFTDIYRITIDGQTYAVEMPRTERGDRLLNPVQAGPEGRIRMRDQLSRRLDQVQVVWGPDRQDMDLEQFRRMYRRVYRADPDRITNVSRVRAEERRLYEEG